MPEVRDDLRELLGIDADHAPKDAPTASVKSLRDALERASIPTRKHYHEAAGQWFECCAMSTKGYTELKFAQQVNPATGQPMSNLQEDEINRMVTYLMYGTTAGLDRETAYWMATSPGWGPDNNKLQAAIQELNPPPRERVDDMIVLIGFCQFVASKLRIMRECGLWGKLAKEIALTDNEMEAVDRVEMLFEGYLRVEDAAQRWGIPFDDARFQYAQQILAERGIDPNNMSLIRYDDLPEGYEPPKADSRERPEVPHAKPPTAPPPKERNSSTNGSNGWMPSALGGNGKADPNLKKQGAPPVLTT